MATGRFRLVPHVSRESQRVVTFELIDKVVIPVLLLLCVDKFLRTGESNPDPVAFICAICQVLQVVQDFRLRDHFHGLQTTFFTVLSNGAVLCVARAANLIPSTDQLAKLLLYVFVL